MDINDLHWTSYRRHLRSLHRSPRTIDTYREAFDLLVAQRPSQDVAERVKADIEELLGDLLDRQSSATAANRFRSWRAFYSWCEAEEIVDASPMRGMKLPSVTDVPPAVLTDDQLRALLAVCRSRSFDDRRDAAIIRVLCEPGSPRVSTLVGMLVDDIDRARDMIRLHSKGDKVHWIPFGAKTGQALDRYLRVRAQHTLADAPQLWLGNRGKPLTRWGVAQMLARRGEAAGVGRVHPHQFRHTSAHVWFDQGGSESDAMELFNWSSAEMPRVYARSTRTERAQRAARRMSPADRL